MMKAVYWSLATYLVFKLIQYFFVVRPGFGREFDPPLREKLLRGEPTVVLVACVIAISAALGSSWYFQRGYEGALEYTADCYGRLGALRHLRDVETPFDALEVFKSVRAARQASSLAAQSLELAPGDADRQMAERLRLHAQRYATLTRQGDRQAIRAEAAAIERCMSEPMISF